MCLYKNWINLIEGQTEESFEKFWEKYSSTETNIYTQILASKNPHVEGVFKELCEKYEADPVIFMGWLDGIQTSIQEPFELENITEDSKIVMDIIWDKLFYNMFDAEADYLYSIPEWNNILTEEEQVEISTKWRKSRTVVKDKTPGRNEPCPCGSGKKYKKCCGANK